MDGNKESIKMSNLEGKITEIWNEIILKERLKTIITNMEENQNIYRKIIKEELTENQNNNREVIKEELTNLWNTSEIPTFKQILEKLTSIQAGLEKENNNQLIKEVIKPELTAVTVMGSGKEPIMIDLSKSKPKLTKGVKQIVNNLAELHKKGKF